MNGSTMTPHAPITEPTAWMRATGAARVRAIAAAGIDPHDPASPFVIAPLTDRPSNVPTNTWERGCDRCGRYCPAGEMFYLFTYQAARRVGLVGGLCELHAQAEGVRK